jgi:luciferase family oxidoreductase group 1
MRLSILDFQTPAGAIELVQAADALGYHRFWIGEHHSQYQCANPLLLATVLAGLTRRIRLGTGGVCLSYANPFRVAEDARLAHYLFPDRLDLGVARGLGYQPALLAALAGAEGGGPADSFAARATALHQYVTGRLPSGHPLAGTPLYLEPGPPVWILGTSPASARLAGALGAGFCISLHHSPELAGARTAFAEYAAAFSPSPEFPEPAAIAVVSTVCAETTAAAAAVAATVAAQAASGAAAAGGGTVGGGEAGNPGAGGEPFFVGSPAGCAEALEGLARRLGVDELMILDFIAGQWDRRLRMYELLAGELGLVRAGRARGPSGI